MGKKKRIEKTDAWNIADWEYSGIISQDMMPLLSAPIVGQKRIDRLKEILKQCSEYYPALIELGYRYIKTGKDEIGKKSSFLKNISDLKWQLNIIASSWLSKVIKQKCMILLAIVIPI